MTVTLGVDCAKWQGFVNYFSLVPLEARFVYAKATHGHSGKDERFTDHITGARKAGLYAGAYHWHVPEQDAKTQADHFVKTIAALGPFDLPPAIDFEQKTAMAAVPLLAHCREVVERVEQALGIRAMLYTGGWYWTQYAGNLDAPWAAERPLWHAEYPAWGLGPGDWTIARQRVTGWLPGHVALPWASRGIRPTVEQFDGDGGLKLPNGTDVDVDAYLGDELQLVQWAASMHLVPPTLRLPHMDEPMGGGTPNAPATPLGAETRAEQEGERSGPYEPKGWTST